MKAPQPVKLVKTPQVVGVQEVPGSNPGGPTKFLKELQIAEFPEVAFWSPTGVQNRRRETVRLARSDLARPDFPQALSSGALRKTNADPADKTACLLTTDMRSSWL